MVSIYNTNINMHKLIARHTKHFWGILAEQYLMLFCKRIIVSFYVSQN